MCIKLAVKWFIAAEQEAYSKVHSSCGDIWMNTTVQGTLTSKNAQVRVCIFFCYSNMCYHLKGNLDLSGIFLLNLMGGPVNQCGFHLSAQFKHS